MDLPSVLLPPILAVHLLATETLAGMLFFLLTVIGPARTVIAELGVDRRSGLDVWCRKVVFACLALMLVTRFLWLGMTAASVSDTNTALEFDPGLILIVLRQTEFGTVWLLRVGIWALLVVILWLVPKRRNLAEDNLPWAGLLLVTLALSGHAAASDGAHHSLRMTIVATHLAATAAWVGSLPPLARLLAKAATGGSMEDVASAREVVRRYSLYAAGAVGFLTLSGLATVGLMLDNGWPGLHSDFGRVLAGKLGLFALMSCLALVNRFWFGPKLIATPRPARLLGPFWRFVMLEYCVASFILLAAAILAQSAPPGQ